MNGREVWEFAQMVQRWFARRGIPSRLADDVVSIAALAIVDTHRRYGLALAAHRSFYFVAAKRQVAGQIKHMLAPYRIGGRAAERGIFEIPGTIQFGHGRNGDGQPAEAWDEGDIAASLSAPPETPEQLLVEAGQAEARRLLLRRIVGIGRRMPAAFRRRDVNKVKKVAETDPAIRRLRSVMMGQEEAAA